MHESSNRNRHVSQIEIAVACRASSKLNKKSPLEFKSHAMSRVKITIEVNSEQLEKLDSLYRDHESHVVRQRAHAMMLLSQKQKKPKDVAAILNVCRVTIYNWINRWRKQGIEGLYDLEGRGRKPLFSPEDEIIILSKIEENPSSLRQIVDQVEQETGKKAHIETLRKVAKKNGKVWKRKRKKVKGQPEPDAYEQGEADLEELRLLASQGEFDLVYFDESGVSLQPVVPYAWQDRGRVGTLAVPSSHSKRINLLGFLNPATDQFDGWQIEGKINSNVVIEVIDEYCDQLTHPAVVVLDNASIHVSKAVAAKIEEWDHRGLSLYFLPKYSPQLNLIEILWRFIKYHWLPASAYESLSNLRGSISQIFSDYGDEYSISFSSV